METFDLVVVGGGVIGCAVIRAVLIRKPGLKTCLIEAESQLAMHQSGRNSGVVHAGYNQKPGSLKAQYVVEGNRRIKEYCNKHNVACVQHGIVVVARSTKEESIIQELWKRGNENGAKVELIDQEHLRQLEPYAAGYAALYAAEGASLDAKGFVTALGREAKLLGARIILSTAVQGLTETTKDVEVRIPGEAIRTQVFVNASGLYVDRLAHQLGVGLDYQIVPFRGEYYRLTAERTHLVRAHIYPPPDLKFPFLGVHFSRTYDGYVQIGPGAVLALGRTAYERTSVNLKDLREMLSFSGFWKLLADRDFRAVATREWQKSFFKQAVIKEACQLVPQFKSDDVVQGSSGIRAQLVWKGGQLIEDFVVEQTPLSIHILNAVSPALTCSLPFADQVASLILARLE